MSTQSLQIGAHLTTLRFGYVHHGLYAGNGRVVHYPGFKQFFRRGRVEEVSLEEFSNGRPFNAVRYQRTKFAGQAAVDRARSRLGEDSYRFWSNNCEHFVQWCLFGESRSLQVEAQRVAFLAFGFVVSLFSILVVSGCAGLPADDARAQVKPAGHYAAERSFASWPRPQPAS